MNKNICKFISASLQDRLEAHSFIYETNPDAMAVKRKLSTNICILVTKGDGEFCFDGIKVEVTKGALVFGFTGETFYVLPKKEFEYSYITFTGFRADALFSRFGISSRRRAFKGFEAVIHFWKENVIMADENTVDIAAEAVLLYTFSRFVQTTNDKENIVGRAAQFLERNFQDSTLSLADVAAEVGYNEKYISHLFKTEMGVGISEYLRSLRVNYAVFLFEHGVDSVKNVAFLSGFSDPLYFSSVFKKQTGKSPKDYKISSDESGD